MILASTLTTFAAEPRVIAHRGLLREAPENTLASYSAALELKLGFELDVRRSRDGVLVILHDETVDRTTNGKGKVTELTLAELKKLDAGSWFDPVFAAERIPTLDEVFALVKQRGLKSVLLAIDVKGEDDALEADMVKLANKHEILSQCVFIGRTIDEGGVRKKLRMADSKTPVCVLAQKAENLQAAIDDANSDWVYARFIPTADEMKKIRQAGKKVFLSGPPVNQSNPDNWRQARVIGADTLLTDFPHDCRKVWRDERAK